MCTSRKPVSCSGDSFRHQIEGPGATVIPEEFRRVGAEARECHPQWFTLAGDAIPDVVTEPGAEPAAAIPEEHIAFLRETRAETLPSRKSSLGIRHEEAA